MRRTPTSISKKRQDIRAEEDLYRQRLAETRRKLSQNLFLTAADKARAAQQIDFCLAEIAKRQEAMRRLRRGTRSQRIAGWA